MFPPTLTLATVCSIYRVGILLHYSKDISYIYIYIYIYISEIFLLNFLIQLYNHHFLSPTKRYVFHDVILFGSSNIHILHEECAKNISVQIHDQKVKGGT